MAESTERSTRCNVVIWIDLGLIAALVVMSRHFASSSLLQEQPRLVGYAILLDLTLTIAGCHWLLGVRLGGLAAWTLIPLLAFGFATARLLLPPEIASTGTLPLIALALVEGAVLVLVVTRIRAIVRGYRAAKHAGFEAFDALEAGVLEIAPKAPRLAAWVRLELQLWALLLFGWFFRPTPRDCPEVFTHHREAGWFGFVGVICFVLLIEGALVHWWLHSSGYVVAKWLVSGLHLYTFAWLIGDAQALRVYRSSLQKRGDEWFFCLSLGLRHRARIPVSEIREVTTGTFERASEDELLAVVQGTANVRIAFRSPALVCPMLGAPKETQRLLLQVDEPAAFRAKLASLLDPSRAGEPAR